MENKVYELLEKMYIEFNDRFSSLEKTTSEIKTEVNKNSMALEKLQTDMNTLAEVQQSFSEQLHRAKDKDGKSIGERLEVIELAVTSTSKSLNNNFEKLSDKIDDLQIDVNTLTAKTVKTDTKVIQFERLLNSDKKQG